MSTVAQEPSLQMAASKRARRISLAGLRAYFFSDTRRTLQTLLGVVWLLDGGLQFQSFMYGRGFIQMLKGMAAGQPHWILSSVDWGANTLGHHQVPLNTLFALVQVAIGLGLLYRPTVRAAILASIGWALVVWWFGEAFGMLFMNMATPLTGAPGAVILYPLVGAIVWPNGRPGGLLGVLGARITWAVLWVLMGGLWLLAVNSSANATSGLIKAAPSGMSWLSSVQLWAQHGSAGHGLVISIVLCGVSWAIAVAVAVNWRARPFLIAAIVLSLAYWVLGQGLGGIFAGGATDPNAGPLFVLLSIALWDLVPYTQTIESPRRVGDSRIAPAGLPQEVTA